MRALRAVYNHEVSLFEKLLPKDRSGTIHQRNIKILVAELFKIKKYILNDIVAQLFYNKNNYVITFVHKQIFCDHR